MSLPDLDKIARLLDFELLAHGLTLMDASEVAGDAFPRIDTDRPALLFGLDARQLPKIARTLRVNYPGTHPVALARDARVKRLTLEELGAETKISRNTVLAIPPLPYTSSPLSVANIMARLRAPVGGCPWDLEQTHESITRALVEETYEVIEAISDQDAPHLKEELGDLFLHVLFQTQIARDENEFAFSDVGAELAAKLIRRHPHVFGDEYAKDAGMVLENWEKIKQQEKKSKGQTEHAETLDAGIPRNLPALTRAQKVSERANRKKVSPASNGLEFDLVRALKQKRGAARERALGQVLLELAAFAQVHGIDAERALNAATKEFVNKNG